MALSAAARISTLQVLCDYQTSLQVGMCLAMLILRAMGLMAVMAVTVVMAAKAVNPVMAGAGNWEIACSNTCLVK
jgi:hypothetical protein